ncbi:hypothetical protein [Kitasatospora sp. NPDC057198]|uniref:hypothetical protein n=1 Tax=Kitasatospora sp. NPDC057198 TaxID=3346046 RepID=UPI00363E47A2
MVRTDALGLGRHLRRIHRSVIGFGGLDVLVDGFALELPLHGLRHLASVTDALGATTRIRCNEAGLPVEVTDPTGAVTRYDRDAFGRVAVLTDHAGNATRFAWTVEGLMSRRTGPDGTAEHWTYDGEGNLLTHVDGAGRIQAFEYTHFETLAASIGPDGARTVFTHDAHMQLVAVTDPLGNTWNYTYDSAGRLIAESDFQDRLTSYRLDPAGQVAERTDPLGRRTTYSYDLRGRVLRQEHERGGTSFRYDRAGHLVGATNADSELVRTVDALGNLLTETVNGRRVTNSRDVLGRRLQRTTPTGHTSTWTYDPAGQPTRLVTPGGSLDFVHDELGQEQARVVNGRLTLANTWDPQGRLTGQTLHSTPSGQQRVLQQRRYSYRAGGSLIAVDDLLAGRRTFDLDSPGRVTAVRAATWNETYSYDPAGNLTEADWPATGSSRLATGPRTFTGTELTTAGRVRYTYDRAGRVTERRQARLSHKPDSWQYTWDGDDRLTQVTTPAAPGTPQEHVDRRFFAIVTDLIGTPTELVDPVTDTIAWRTTPTLWGNSSWPSPSRTARNIHQPLHRKAPAAPEEAPAGDEAEAVGHVPRSRRTGALMESVLTDALAHLPLKLSNVETDYLGARISGPNWHLRINTEWQILDPRGSTALHLDSGQEPDRRRLIDLLVGHKVVDLSLKQHDEFGDICLTLDDGSTVEVISEASYGEWLFSVWRLGDTRRLPIYDLPGPC